MTPSAPISYCRLCDSPDLSPILNLGTQALTGVFPRTRDESVLSGPLELVKCQENPRIPIGKGSCGLVQLRHSYPRQAMYGDNYGYRSGLNPSMVQHLHGLVKQLREQVSLLPGDVVLDIGSNDGTLLSAYPKDLVRVGIDPTAEKFRRFYPDKVAVVADFFSADAFRNLGTQPARIVTSIAMFYDLEDPLAFMRQVKEVLAPAGVWLFEQSYLPTMMERTAYDTVCHEHVEYYRLAQIEWLCQRAGLKIIAVDFNDTNGGSFAVTVAHADSFYPELPALGALLEKEKPYAGSPSYFHAARSVYDQFLTRVVNHRHDLRSLLFDLHLNGRTLMGYGASTKGNVLLQYCGFGEQILRCIADVNPEKHGRLTPGTGIPIVPESTMRAAKPDYLLVLPWHFREGIIAREASYLKEGGTLLFPLPEIQFVSEINL